jgi:hypothetical protein
MYIGAAGSDWRIWHGSFMPYVVKLTIQEIVKEHVHAYASNRSPCVQSTSYVRSTVSWAQYFYFL